MRKTSSVFFSRSAAPLRETRRDTRRDDEHWSELLEREELRRVCVRTFTGAAFRLRNLPTTPSDEDS
jgi:hypothetical protein